MCLWYAQADTRHKPAAAIVMDSDGRGGLSLMVFPHNQAPHPIQAVRHVSNPAHQATPRPSWSIQSGGWDYLAGESPQARQETPRDDYELKDVDRIHALRASGLQPNEVQRRMGVRIWKLCDVIHVLENYKPSQAS